MLKFYQRRCFCFVHLPDVVGLRRLRSLCQAGQALSGSCYPRTEPSLCVQGIEFPYTTCKTKFYGDEGQAVFASIINDTDLGVAKALCVLRAPFQDEEQPILEARIEVSQARGPSSAPERSAAFNVHFSQAPVVSSGAVVYTSEERFGSVTVQITHIDGFLRVRTHCALYNPTQGSSIVISLDKRQLSWPSCIHSIAVRQPSAYRRILNYICSIQCFRQELSGSVGTLVGRLMQTLQCTVLRRRLFLQHLLWSRGVC